MRAFILVFVLVAQGCASTAQAVDPPGRAVQAARIDAAQLSGLSVSLVQLVGLEVVTWLDGSLGCPQTGLQYTQALVSGWRIQLRVGAEVWDYHASERGGLVRCPPSQAQDPLPGSRD